MNIRFRKARKMTNMTRAEVAARIGVTKRDIREWERGEAEVPMWCAGELAALFDITAPFLQGKVDD